MTTEQALAELSPAHAVALRLHHEGADDHTIGAALGIPDESVPTLLDVAQSKFDALVDPSPSDD